MTDVHLDGHREAFNETFRDLGMEGASPSQDEYLSLLRSGGGTAHGMVERYFHYGYPTLASSSVYDDMLADASASSAAGAVPEGYEDASPEVIVAAARARRAETRSTKRSSASDASSGPTTSSA